MAKLLSTALPMSSIECKAPVRRPAMRMLAVLA